METYPVLVVTTGDGHKFYFSPSFTSVSLGQFNEDGTYTPSNQTFKTFQPFGTIKWGSFSANFWVNVGAGATWGNAIHYAKMAIGKYVKNAKMEVEWKTH